jgi:beta-phosphoglucomutase
MMIRGIIFDLDGTVIDNEDSFGRAFCHVLKENGISCANVTHTSGIGIVENWRNMKRALNLEPEPETLAKQTIKFYLDHLDEVKVRPGFHASVIQLRQLGIQIHLATSSVKSIAGKVMKGLKIEKLFDSLTFGDEVPHKKPAPDIFIKALSKGHLSPSQAIVIEDSPAGITAAQRANIKLVVAIKTHRFNIIDLSQADRIINHFSELRDLVR